MLRHEACGVVVAVVVGMVAVVVGVVATTLSVTK